MAIQYTRRPGADLRDFLGGGIESPKGVKNRATTGGERERGLGRVCAPPQIGEGSLENC